MKHRCTFKVYQQIWMHITEVEQANCLIETDSQPTSNEIEDMKEEHIGGLQKIDHLTEEHLDIVEFAKQYLKKNKANLINEEEDCNFEKSTFQVENFSQQIVAGAIYKFDLVQDAENSGCSMKHRCTFKVYQQIWMHITEVEQANCLIETDSKPTSKKRHCANRTKCKVNQEYRNGQCVCKYGNNRQGQECRGPCLSHEEYHNGKCECKYGLDQGSCRLCPKECKSKGGCVKRGLEYECRCKHGSIFDQRTNRCQTCTTIDGKVTNSPLVFVIDITSSMGSTPALAKQILDRLISEDMNIPRYQLFTFHDQHTDNIADNTKLVLDTDDVAALEAATSSLRFSGGGDIPETMTQGLLLALRNCSPKSLIIVFTDAPTKNPELEEEINRLRNEKEVEVFIVLNFEIDAKSTALYKRMGQVFQLTDVSVDTLLENIEQKVEETEICT